MTKPYCDIGILGCGMAVPDTIRRSDDPIFSAIHRQASEAGVAEADLFNGIEERRILTEGERLPDLALAAAQQALLNAKRPASVVDRLYGYLSVSEYVAPNTLFELHPRLGLADSTAVLPINCEYSNFVMSLVLAWEAMLAGHSRCALVVCAQNWTQHMDYSQGHSFSVGDGAGAAVVGRGSRLAFRDYMVQTLNASYGAMTMKHRPLTQEPERYHTTFRFEEGGVRSVLQDGMNGPVNMVNALLRRNGIDPSDVALFSHQATRDLIDHWTTHIKPARLYNTLAKYGNMTMATLPVNLASFWTDIRERYVVLVAVGLGYHQAALLLERVDDGKQ